MLILSSAFAAIIPMATYLILIWRFDRYDREPIKLVLTCYFWGAVGAIIFSLIGSFIFSGLLSFFASSGQQLNHLGTIVVAPVVEEITKGIFLFVIRLSIFQFIFLERIAHIIKIETCYI